MLVCGWWSINYELKLLVASPGGSRNYKLQNYNSPVSGLRLDSWLMVVRKLGAGDTIVNSEQSGPDTQRDTP